MKRVRLASRVEDGEAMFRAKTLGSRCHEVGAARGNSTMPSVCNRSTRKTEHEIPYVDLIWPRPGQTAMAITHVKDTCQNDCQGQSPVEGLQTTKRSFSMS